MTAQGEPEFEQPGLSTQLIMLLYAYTLTLAQLHSVRAAIVQTFPDADLFVPHLRASRFSIVYPIAIVRSQPGFADAFPVSPSLTLVLRSKLKSPS
jgi:hypothetical protein